jgi:hypothetical protein
LVVPAGAFAGLERATAREDGCFPHLSIILDYGVSAYFKWFSIGPDTLAMAGRYATVGPV